MDVAPQEKEVIRRSEQDLQRLLAWVRSAESRLAAVLPLSTAMLGALAVLAPAAHNWTVAGGISTALAVLLLLLSLVFAAAATFPRTSGPKGSLVYFGGIVDRDLSQYSKAVTSRTTIEYLEDLMRQCHRNAQIAERKHAWIQRSMSCLLLSTIPWTVSLFVLYWADS